MVKIASKDFNKSMDNYLKKRRTSPDSKKINIKLPFGKSKGPDEDVPDIGPSEVHVEYKKPGKLSKLFSFRKRLIKEADNSEELSPEEMARLRAMEDDIEETEEKIMEKEQKIHDAEKEEADLVEEREGKLKKFFNKINIFSRTPMETVEVPEDEYMASEPVIDEDVKDVLKITHKWIEQLTPTKKRSFKASKDFQKYKAVLEKYGLIKKK